MVHHGFRSKEKRSARKQIIDYAKQHHSPHCWLPAKMMYPANSTKRFSWLTRSTSILSMMNVQINNNNNDICNGNENGKDNGKTNFVEINEKKER